LKCLEKERQRRYQSALELADDLARFRRGEPIVARAVSRFERGWRWVRRNPVVSALAAATMLAMLVAIGVWGAKSLQLARASKGFETDREAAKKKEEERTRNEASEKIAIAYGGNIDAAERLIGQSNPHRAREVLDSCPEHLRSWEWYFLRNQCRENATVLAGHSAAIRCVVYRPRSGQVLSAGDDQTIRVWDANSGAIVRVLTGHTAAISELAFSESGHRFASFQRFPPMVKVWHADTGESLLSVNVEANPNMHSFAFSPDGKLLAVSSGRQGFPKHSIAVWDVDTGTQLFSAPSDGNSWVLRGLSFSPDSRLVAGGQNKIVNIWDARSGKLQKTLDSRSKDSEEFRATRFEKGGQRLTALGAKQIFTWDLPGGDLGPQISADGLQSVRFNSNGDRAYAVKDGVLQLIGVRHGTSRQANTEPCKELLAADANGRFVLAVDSNAHVAKIVDSATDQPATYLRGHSQAVTCAAFSADGKSIATGGADRVVRLWSRDATPRDKNVTELAVRAMVNHLAFSPDSKQLAVAARAVVLGSGPPLPIAPMPKLPFMQNNNGGEISGLQLWNAVTGAEQPALDGRRKEQPNPAKGPPAAVRIDHNVVGVCYSADGKHLVSVGGHTMAADGAGEIIIWNLEAKTPFRTLHGHKAHLCGLTVSPKDRWIATADLSGTVLVRHFAVEAPHRIWRGPAGLISVAFVSENRLAAGYADGGLVLWDIDEDRQIYRLEHKQAIVALAVSRDGQLLAAVTKDGSTTLWSTETGEKEHVLKNAVSEGTSAAFTPDGRRLATASKDGIVRLWDVHTGREVFVLREAGTIVAFSPDGETLATGGKATRLWHGPKK
jgi:WD40 repeat protein